MNEQSENSGPSFAPITDLTKSLLGQVHVKSSVVNPMLWLCGGAELFFLIAAYFMPQYAGILIFTAIIALVAGLLAYAYFAVKDPNRLQSEEFQITQQQIQMMQGKQGARLLTDNTMLANPVLEHSSSKQEPQA